MDKNTRSPRKKESAHQQESPARKAKQKKQEKELDQTLESTFPASDATAKY